MTYSFTKQVRLLKGPEFEAIKGTRLSVSNPNLLLLAKKNAFNHPRLGLAIAKKHAKLAVERNRIKRQIRESFRLNLHQIPAVDIIIFSRGKTKELDNHALRICIDEAWQQLNKKVH